MSGRLLLQQGSRVLDNRKDHGKYVVRIVAHEEKTESGSTILWVATAGWDAKVFLYRIEIPDGAFETASLAIGEPVAQIKLSTNPESLLFVRHPDSGELVLLVSRRDSTYIYYYQAKPGPTSIDQPATPPECSPLGRQNLAPHSNAWVAFSPAFMALSPRDPGLLAVATSTLPHLKVMVVRLLFPSTELLGGIECAYCRWYDTGNPSLGSIGNSESRGFRYCPAGEYICPANSIFHAASGLET
ncbi:hypothetical protein N7470_008070 [Penicillium chermesinum]|nr:hypothetical protein N7470_008070 [Penicillium chermesinum]